MLKLHDFECPVCNFEKEELIDAPPNLVNIHCPKCRAVMRHVVLGGKAHTFKPFWHEHLGHHPVYIDSWSRYRKELEKTNSANVLAT